MSKYKKPLGSEIRAAREQREMTDPKLEANRREASFLANLSRAQSDFEWIAENQAWTLLGHESLADWWAAKVQPVMSALSMRLSPEMATRVIEKVKAAEAELPASQRRTARELAELVGTSEWTARGRQDRDKRRGAAVADLEDTSADPLAAVPDAEAAIAAALANRSTPADRDPEAIASTGDAAVATAGQPEEDHPGTAGLGEVEEGDNSSTSDGVGAPSDAQPQVDDVSNGVDSDETEVQGEAPRQPSAPVELPQGQATTGVSVAAPAGDPERSGWDEGQGQAAASVPAPEIPSWLTAITNVCTAVHDLDDQDPLAAAEAVDDDLAAELGSAVLMVTAWYRRMQEAK